MLFHRQMFAAVIGALALSVVTPVVAAAAPAPIEYANLGDSYSAGSGVLPLVPGAPLQCARSQNNFSHIVAARRGYRLTDASCGSARTADFYGPQAGIAGTQAQLNAVRPTTDIITVMMGGNDSGTFGGTLQACIRAALNARGVADPCRRQYGQSLIAPIAARTQPALTRGLRAIRAKAPRARILVVGYPSVFPRSGNCSAGFLIAPGDTPYVRSVADALNLAVRRAAEATGATFVDMAPASVGHTACTPPGVRYVEPILGTTQIIPAHPNARGERAIATQVLAAINRR
ncbi:SGNH/GDSL hydrolase family protein [Williamsia maris]|uniref:GDSL-like Lipase/Acylhydrolase family protein n=1 Tax=Williamsia maris TaxID=72806 RepID=A0ABT1HD95_9NOCA|nr:SGNH/GDSL hydrolase family protein [Williamsia maris]MCP2175638.1 GDSL-like Lipase/Acylhydrolase family protein [Williamsia maris]